MRLDWDIENKLQGCLDVTLPEEALQKRTETPSPKLFYTEQNSPKFTQKRLTI